MPARTARARSCRRPSSRPPTTPKRKTFIEAYQKAYNIDRIPSPVSAAQGYDFGLSARRGDEAGRHRPTARRSARRWRDLKTKVDGVVTTYDHPFTASDHEAISTNIPVFGIVKDGRVAFWSKDDEASAGQIRVKGAVN